RSKVQQGRKSLTALLDRARLATEAQFDLDVPGFLEPLAGRLTDQDPGRCSRGRVNVVEPAAAGRVAPVGPAHVDQVLPTGGAVDSHVDLAVVELTHGGRWDL